MREAMNIATGEMVAIKLMGLHARSNITQEKHFENVRGELNMMTKLRHPHIVSFLGYQQTDQYFRIHHGASAWKNTGAGAQSYGTSP